MKTKKYLQYISICTLAVLFCFLSGSSNILSRTNAQVRVRTNFQVRVTPVCIRTKALPHRFTGQRLPPKAITRYNTFKHNINFRAERTPLPEQTCEDHTSIPRQEVVDTYRELYTKSAGDRPLAGQLIELINFASVFFANHYDSPRNFVLIHFEAIPFGFLKTNKNFIVRIFNKKGQSKTIETYEQGGKTLPLYADGHASWLPTILQALKELGDQEDNIIASGEGIPGLSFREAFAELEKSVIRLSNLNASYATTLGDRQALIEQKFAQADGSNTVVINGLPKNIAEVEEIGKNVKNVDRWLEVVAELDKILEKHKCTNLRGGASELKNLLLSNNNVIVIVADAGGESIRIPGGFSISVEQIAALEPRTADATELPVLWLLACNTGFVKTGTVNDIITLLRDKGYIIGALAPVDLVRPDKKMTNSIDMFLKGELKPTAPIPKDFNFELIDSPIPSLDQELLAGIKNSFLRG